VEALRHFASLQGAKNDPAFSFLSCTAGTAETMNVRLAIPGKANLDDVSDLWKVHLEKALAPVTFERVEVILTASSSDV
jgi:hypothetical protein